MRPYALPEGNVALAFSGGRTSGKMLREIQRANNDFADRIEAGTLVVSFQNTGREMPETLDFVAECSERWGIPVVWLEYRPEAPRFEVVDHASASRKGEPFDALIRKRGMLPNRAARFCTAELKVHTMTRYLRSLGWDHWTVARGLRADEAHRVKRSGPKHLEPDIEDLFDEDEAKPDVRGIRERWTGWHPLHAAGVTKRHVMAFWRTQPFNLRLADVKGKTPYGNCDGCFLKSETTLTSLQRDHPERAAWWEAWENRIPAVAKPGEFIQWSPRYSRADLRRFLHRQGDWIVETDVLCNVEEGECFG